MKQSIDIKVVIISIFFVFYGCAGVTLKDYQPRSADEEEIIEVLVKHERAWNEQDISGFMETFHDSALIELGCGGQLAPVNEFADRIKRMMAEYPTVKLVNPRLDISGNEVVVKVKSTELGDESHLFRLEMLRENDRWFIIKETCI